MLLFSETDLSNRACHSREFTLRLIDAELVSARFFKTLAEVGLRDCNYRIDLSILVFTSLGFNDVPENLLDFYFRQIDARCMLINPDNGYVRNESKAVADKLNVEIKKYVDRNSE